MVHNAVWQEIQLGWGFFFPLQYCSPWLSNSSRHAFPLSLTLSLFISCYLSFPLSLTLVSPLFSPFPVEGEYESRCGRRMSSRNTGKKKKRKKKKRLLLFFSIKGQIKWQALFPAVEIFPAFSFPYSCLSLDWPCIHFRVRVTVPKGELFRLNQYCSHLLSSWQCCWVVHLWRQREFQMSFMFVSISGYFCQKMKPPSSNF